MSDRYVLTAVERAKRDLKACESMPRGAWRGAHFGAALARLILAEASEEAGRERLHRAPESMR